MQLLLNVIILSLYFVGYGALHSLLASHTVKEWVEDKIGPKLMRGYRLFYNIFALITLLPFFWLIARLPDRTLYVVPAPWRWGMLGGQLLAAVAAGITLLQTGLPHFLGLTQLTDRRYSDNTDLSTRGFYRWVRHPLYFFSMLFIWLSPIMMFNQLVSYILFTLYFYIGSIYEECKLVDQFGEAYRNYQQRVARLVPFIF